MATNFQILNPAVTCLVVPGPAGSSKSSGSFTLLLGDKVDRFETPAFQVNGTDLKIKLKIVRGMNTTIGGLGIQFVLVYPHNDVVEITINGAPAILINGPNSFVYQVPSNEKWCHGKEVQPSTAFLIRLTDIGVRKSPTVRSETFKQLPKDVKLVVGEKEISFSKELLTSKSDVFRAMFEHDTKERQTKVVEITDFSFEVVEQMTKFLIHDYCVLHWDTKSEELEAIADKYNIIGMKEFAEEKKNLLNRIY